MISFRQADLLPTLQKQNEPQFRSERIVLTVSGDDLLWEFPAYANIDSVFPKEIKERIMDSFENCGFLFDEDGLPYYVFDIIHEDAVQMKVKDVAKRLTRRGVPARGDIEPGGYQAVIDMDLPL